MLRKTLTLLVLFIASFLPLSTTAKTLTLYEEPQETAKHLGTLDSQVGIITIFTPEKSDWIKVADPRNGQVGWIKLKDLSTDGKTNYTFSQHFINTGEAPQTYQIIQWGGPTKMTAEEVKRRLQQVKKEQAKRQEQLDKAMQTMINELHQLYQGSPTGLTNNPAFIMPVLVLPAPNYANPKPEVPTKNPPPKN